PTTHPPPTRRLTLSLPDALPIYAAGDRADRGRAVPLPHRLPGDAVADRGRAGQPGPAARRRAAHTPVNQGRRRPPPGAALPGRRDRKSNTSELQSPDHLVCRLLL